MCTLSWRPAESAYQIFFNRDERRSRPAAAPPAVRGAPHAPYIAPIDPEGGGAWIAANVHGVTLCLLNQYQHPVESEPIRPTSRGKIVLQLATCRTPDEVRRGLRDLSLTQFRPFLLAVAAPVAPIFLFGWDGRTCDERTTETPGLVATSSALVQEKAERDRAALFLELRDEYATLDEDLFAAFHASHRPVRGPTSVCMHRADAQTVAHSRVTVSNDQVWFHHVVGPPCEGRLLPPVSLTRAPAKTPV